MSGSFVSIAMSGSASPGSGRIGKLIYTDFLGSKMAAPKIGASVRPNTSNMLVLIFKIPWHFKIREFEKKS